MIRLNEDTLVQQTMAHYMRDKLQWETIHAFDETFGLDGTLGRVTKREVILKRYLRRALRALNPGLPEDAYADALRQITDYSSSQSIVATNREKYDLLRNGVKVAFRNVEGELVKQTLRVFDFNDATNNHFLAVRELWVQGPIYKRRADIVGFVNGIPLLFVELKSIHRDLRVAYEANFSDYKDTIPDLFHHNAFVIFANGIKAKIGAITSRYEHFHEWKRLAEDEPGRVDMETLLKGICEKRNFMDLFENFILFDESPRSVVKIIGRNHQFLGVNRALDAITDRHKRKGKLGVFWHTQGSGKSYSMAFLAHKVHRKLGGNFTFLICTDRDDLDTQIYKTFAGCGLANNDADPCRASSGEHLTTLLGQHKSFIFTLIHKFNKRVDPGNAATQRDDIIVFSDEAHRTQYGEFAFNMRNLLPNAGYMGFTGTPLLKDDELTRRLFGDYISTYDFKRAWEDGATVPLYYDSRGEKLGLSIGDLNERIAEKLEEFETDDINLQQRLEDELKREYHIITADERLDQIARDFVTHYSNAWEGGKAMLVCIDKITCVRMHELINKYWELKIKDLESQVKRTSDDQDEVQRIRQIQWMKETKAAVVISEEQGEVDKFRKWGLDILPHRKLIKNGIEISPELRARPEYSSIQSLDLEDAFKEPDHPFRIAIVCAMWMTGFDVPCLSTLYLDKPLKAHTLMQAIARANRVYEGKTNGLIVDYCGVLQYLRKALADYAGVSDRGRGTTGEGTNPARPEEELLAELQEAIELVKTFLFDNGASLDAIIESDGFDRNAAILCAKEAANGNDETRKTFEIMCREVFRKFKACINVASIHQYRDAHEAIRVVYKSLQEDREAADISDIMQQLQGIVSEAISVVPDGDPEPKEPFDISKIDFDRLRKEFERSPAPNTTVQSLSHLVGLRLQRLLKQNPLRTDFQEHYEKIVDAYNKEKDRPTIEQTFEQLLDFVKNLSEEETRAVKEGLTEESLAVFDLLKKPDLSAAETKRVKKVSIELLAKIKVEIGAIDRWRDKETTRNSVRTTIRDFLWGDPTGLPTESYSDDEVMAKEEDVYRHILWAYPQVPSPYYAEAS